MNTDDLIPKVVQDMTTIGKVRPIVYAQLAGTSAQPFPLINFMGDGRMKAHLLFLAGREAGRRNQASKLEATTFISETWLTQGQQNPTPGERPPANIPQKEGVMFAVAENRAPFETLVKMYEIERKGKNKKATGLVFLAENVDNQGLMGLAFIAGWKSRNMTDEEVHRLQPSGMRAFLAREDE